MREQARDPRVPGKPQKDTKKRRVKRDPGCEPPCRVPPSPWMLAGLLGGPPVQERWLLPQDILWSHNSQPRHCPRSPCQYGNCIIQLPGPLFLPCQPNLGQWTSKERILMCERLNVYLPWPSDYATSLDSTLHCTCWDAVFVIYFPTEWTKTGPSP